MSESNIFGNKWLPIDETTPSGKVLYRCSVCGAEDPAPTKHHDCRLKLAMDEPARIRAELEAANAEVEQLRVQLAGCGVAALGGTSEPANEGDYGWSPAYQDVLSLRQKLEAAEAENERLMRLIGFEC